MKILFLFTCFFAAAGFSGFSQSLSLSNQFGQVVPNSTIIQPGTPDSNTLLTFLDVKNTSGNTINVLCKKQEMSLLDSTQTYMCWANFCYAPHILVSPNAVSVGPGETYSGFKAIYAQMAYNNFFIGESVVRWVFFNQANADDSVGVTVRYQTFPVGLGEIHDGEGVELSVFPNPASDNLSFTYSIPSGFAAELLVQDARGVVIKTYELPANTSHLSADVVHLADGLYFCSLLIDGNRTLTKKVMVKH